MSARETSEIDDRAWMEQALALGALGEGATSPNPRVGCLLGLGVHIRRQLLARAFVGKQVVVHAVVRGSARCRMEGR